MKTLLLLVAVLVVVAVVAGQDDNDDKNKKCPRIPKVWKKKIRLCSKEKRCPHKMICCEYKKEKTFNICVFPYDADKSLTSEWYGDKGEFTDKHDDCDEYEDDDDDSSEEKMDDEKSKDMDQENDKHGKKDGRRKRCHGRHHGRSMMMATIGLGVLVVVCVIVLVGCCIRRRRMYRGQFQHKRMDIQNNMVSSYKQYPQTNMTQPTTDLTKEELKASLGVDFSNSS